MMANNRKNCKPPIYFEKIRYQFSEINKINQREDTKHDPKPKPKPDHIFKIGDIYYYKFNKPDKNNNIGGEVKITGKVFKDDKGEKRIQVKSKTSTYTVPTNRLFKLSDDKVNVGAPKVKEAQPTTVQNLQDADKKLKPHDA